MREHAAPQRCRTATLAAAAALGFLFAACVPLADASKATLNLEHVQTIDPGAVCNDGSPAGYYIVHSSDSAYQNIWVLYLEGGMWCYTNETCQYRYTTATNYMSSNVWPWELNLGGIFDTNPAKSPFAAANKVFAAYCSSDAWVGNTDDASAETFGFVFRGQRILRAILGALVGIHQLGQRPGHRLLLAGCSAGARGAMFNLDYIPGILEEFKVAYPVQVMGLLDSPMWIDDPPLYPSVVPLLNQTSMAYAFMNATARLGDACAEYYFSDPYRCLFGQYRAPFITTPYLINSAQFDKFQLPYDLGNSNPPYTGAQATYADAFQTEMRTVLSQLPTPKQNGSTVFSPACFTHCLSEESTFWGVHVNDVSLRDLVQEWFFEGVITRADDNCTGFKCGQCRGASDKAHGQTRKRVTSKAGGVQVSLVLHTSPSQTSLISTGPAASTEGRVAPTDEVGVTTGPLARSGASAAAQYGGRTPGGVVARNLALLLLLLVGILCCMVRLVRRDASGRGGGGDLEGVPLVERSGALRRGRMADNVLLLNPRSMGARTQGF